MNEQQEQELIENVKSLTDRMTMVDEVFKQLRVGRSMVLAFQCGHSGLYLPGDYVKNWGRGYGSGLGPNPVSEVLDTDYFTAPPEITPDIRKIEDIAHPVGATFAQVDYMLVDSEAYEANRAILAKSDPFMDARMKIIYPKQLVNKNSRLPVMRMKWLQATGEN